MLKGYYHRIRYPLIIRSHAILGALKSDKIADRTHQLELCMKSGVAVGQDDMQGLGWKETLSFSIFLFFHKSL